MDYINEMDNLVQNLTVVENKNQRVLTTQQLADVYETDINNIQQNFKRNSKHFEEGKHYFLLQGDELKEFKSQLTISQMPLISKYTSQLYLWTEKGANRHCKILDTDKAWEQFDNLEEVYFRVKNQTPAMPTTYKEALQHLLVQVEENERLALENKQQTKVIEKQSEVIGEMAPKADYFDALVDRKLLTSIRDTAKELGVKERTFTEWLIQRNLCYRDKKRKIKPYVNKMQYFELKEFTTIWGHSDTQTLITPKGRETFRLLLIKDGLIKDKNKQMELETLLKDNEVVKSDFYS